jgi:parallel beta-helix repeat protein
MFRNSLLAIAVGVSLHAQERVIHVALNGSDAADGSAENPVRTVGKAVSIARDSATAAKVVLANGRYELSETIALTEQNSEHPLTISAAPNAKAVISGGRMIAGWKHDSHNPNIWTVDVPGARAGKWTFRELFVNGKRKIRARTPNDGFFRIDGPSSEDKPMKLKFHGENIKKKWMAFGEVEVVALLAWSDIRMQIREVDETNRIATLSGNPRPSNKEANAQYWVENALEFVDSPGEWYLNSRAGVLYYWPEPGEDITKAEVIAPMLEDLVILKGTPEKPVRNLNFSGIEFAHTGWSIGTNGYADTQAAVAVHGDFRAEYAQDVKIENCTFSHLAGYGLELGKGCQRFSIIGNEFADLGAGGIRIGENVRPKSSAEENHTHRVTDNDLHDMGRVYPPAVGILIMHSGTNQIAHNDVHDLFYTAISVGWNWGYQETPCRENVIEFNHLHDIGKGMLSDMGGIYTLGIQHGTVLRNNLIHDVNAFTYGGWGLYTDEGSTGILLENNVVYRCKSAGFHQHYGKENVLRNNIFALNRENQLMRTRPEPHISFTFTNNIVYFDSGNLLGSDWSNDHYVMDRNVYFDTRLAANPDKLKFGNATWSEWKARGHDEHSLMADPLFVDPAQFDFKLKPESPALKMGFKQIDVSTVGVRPPGAR